MCQAESTSVYSFKIHNTTQEELAFSLHINRKEGSLKFSGWHGIYFQIDTDAIPADITHNPNMHGHYTRLRGSQPDNIALFSALVKFNLTDAVSKTFKYHRAVVPLLEHIVLNFIINRNISVAPTNVIHVDGKCIRHGDVSIDYPCGFVELAVFEHSPDVVRDLLTQKRKLTKKGN